MARLVLSVGNCAADHVFLTHALNSRFDVEIATAGSVAEAIERVGANSYDLILVNRLLDETGESGIELIKRIIECDPNASAMLVTNFADQQELAIHSGAKPGYGKATLNTPATLEHLANWLN